MQQILLGCLNCWNDIDSFKARDYFFTRMGSLSYHPEDDRLMDRKIGTIIKNLNVMAETEEVLTRNKESFVTNKQDGRRMTTMNKGGPRKTVVKPLANNQQVAQTLSLQSYLKSTFNPVSICHPKKVPT